MWGDCVMENSGVFQPDKEEGGEGGDVAREGNVAVDMGVILMKEKRQVDKARSKMGYFNPCFVRL
jgi:hypothetical protein